jgi:penicillin-insensitive murein endopeptidase
MQPRAPIAVAATLAVLAAGTVVALRSPAEPMRGSPPVAAPSSSPTPPVAATPAPESRRAERTPIRWRASVALGVPSAGRLVRGVRLPAARSTFFTWDPVRRRAPNRAWRRWATDRLVRTLLAVARAYRARHPRAPRIAIGDLSRPHGGDFGRRFGPIGHASHQNGLDADVYYPRADGRERAPRHAGQIHRRRSQTLVDLFLAADPEVIFVGPRTGLGGPPGRVQVLVNHDNHLHVRLAPEAAGRRAAIRAG